MEKYLTVNQVAEKLQLTPATVYAKIRAGIIPTHPWSEKPRIPIEALENWDNNAKVPYRERQLIQELELKDKEIQELKNIIRSMIKLGLEVEL